MTVTRSKLLGTLSALLLVATACGNSSGSSPGEDAGGASEECISCLESGGTWQPEASSCTEDCDLQDISCFRDECPGACEDACSNCFSRAECEAQECTWNVEAETAWCSD